MGGGINVLTIVGKEGYNSTIRNSRLEVLGAARLQLIERFFCYKKDFLNTFKIIL